MKKNFIDLYMSQVATIKKYQRVEHSSKNKLIKLLSEESAKNCEGKVTKEEFINSLNEIKNTKSSGSDSLTAEFYKRFWEEIGDYVVQSINSAFDKGELMNYAKQKGLSHCYQ